MLVDCQTCPVRNVHCADCMVTALTAIPVGVPHIHAGGSTAQPINLTTNLTTDFGPDISGGLPLDRAERRAVSVLVAAGLVTHHVANAARARADSDMAHTDGRVTMAG